MSWVVKRQQSNKQQKSIPNWVTQGNTTTVNVDLSWVQVKDLDVGQSDNTEGFVDLPEVDVLNLEAGSLQGNRDGKRRSEREVNRSSLSITISYKNVSIGLNMKWCLVMDDGYLQTILAKGAKLFFWAYSALVTTRALAPSFKVEALAAVTVPFLSKAGLKVGTFSKLILVNSSSSVTRVVLPLETMDTGTISFLKNPC